MLYPWSSRMGDVGARAGRSATHRARIVDADKTLAAGHGGFGGNIQYKS